MKKESEYDIVREEMMKIQDCITEYIKMFFAASAATVGFLLFFFRENQSFPTPEMSGYAVLLLSMIVIAFSSILFHKFNTNNRYAGYVRAISHEYVKVGPHSEEEFKDLTQFLSFPLWELSLSIIYTKRIDSAIVNDAWPDQKKHAIHHLKLVRADDASLQTKILSVITKTIAGGLMIIRAPIFRYPTRSWTYPYAVSIALFVVGLFLIIGWAEIATKIGGRQLYIQAAMLSYVIICWLGMFLRLYRVCGDDGDRTIDSYTFQFLLAREEALKKFSNVGYPWSSMQLDFGKRHDGKN